MRHGWMRMATWALVLGLVGTGPSLARAEDDAGPDWSGDWITDEGVMVLEQDGTKVTGTYGSQGATIDATIEGRELTGAYRVNNLEGRIAWTMEDGDHHFTGQWIHPRGNKGTWRGWKSDPAASSGKTASAEGTWVTSWGILRLTQKGKTVEGTYSNEGWSTVTGEVRGRTLHLDWKRLRWSGKAVLELTPDGSRLFGKTDADTPETWIGLRTEGWEAKPKLKAGAIAKAITTDGMLHFVRPPDGWRKGRATDALVLLHGSNWTTAGMVAVTARMKDLGKRFMIIGLQGPRWATWSNADDLRFNYHYVNWMGRSTYKGYPHTDRESPWLVAQALKELQETHKLGRIFLGGHSQGGFLTFLLHMHHPELVAGTFPVAGGLVMQAEPDVFEDAELRTAQRATPMAVVHGTGDGVVPFSTAAYIQDRFQQTGFARWRLIAPAMGHPYDFLPIADAVDWLDALTHPKVDVLVAFAQAAAKAERWEDVGAAWLRAGDLGCRRKLAEARDAWNAAAEGDAARFQAAIAEDDNNDWIEDFLVWKARFQHAPAVASVMEAFRTLRAAHDEKAEALIQEGRAAFRQRNGALGREKYEEVLERWYAATRYPVVKRWVEGL